MKQEENLLLQLSQHTRMETDRLLLRPVTLADAEDMFVYASDEETTRYTFATNQDISETRNNIASIFLNHPLGNWGIELKETGQFIGTIDFHKIDSALKKAYIGYCIHKDFWNQGITTEALKRLLKLAFEELGMNKLMAVHDQANPASGRVMAKAGMLYSHDEPYARFDPKEEGRVVTWVHYSLTKEQYGKN